MSLNAQQRFCSGGPMSPTSGVSAQVPQMRRTTQACDACKLRKVKCNGETRCQQCSHLNLRCVYSAPKPRQKSLKRGQLIAKYKQRTNGTVARAAGYEEPEHSDSTGSYSPSLPTISTLLSESPSSAITASSPPQDSGYFSNFLHDYEVSVYPVNPIITVAEVQSLIQQMHSNSEARAFIYAYVAVTLFLTGYTAEVSHADASTQVDYWCNEAARARGPMLPTDKATIPRIMTAQFLHICLMGLRMLDMAFFYLRDSITMIQMLRVDHPEVMRTLPLHERARRQRLYCEAFVHERYLAISNNRPIVLPPLQHLPELDPSLPTGIHEGFNQIISLFSLIDNDFVMNWLGSHTGSTTVTSTWVENKQKQIDAEQAGGDEGVARLTDMQQADLIITKHWLRTLVWQMAMSECLLSSAASKESMSLLFPVRLSKQLRNLVGKMSRQAIEIHGSGIQQKLFELTDTIANVIITVPATTAEETAGRVDDFMFLVNFFFSFPRFDSMQRDILQKKLEKLQSLFPYSANTPDSTLPVGAVQDQDLSADDPWLSVMKTMPESTHGGIIQGNPSNHPSPQSPVNAMPQRPARMWQDMTRRLSMAPSSAPGTIPDPLGSKPH